MNIISIDKTMANAPNTMAPIGVIDMASELNKLPTLDKYSDSTWLINVTPTMTLIIPADIPKITMVNDNAIYKYITFLIDVISMSKKREPPNRMPANDIICLPVHFSLTLGVIKEPIAMPLITAKANTDSPSGPNAKIS